MPLLAERARDMVAWALANFDTQLTASEHAILVQTASRAMQGAPPVEFETTAFGPELRQRAEAQGWQVPETVRLLDAEVREDFVRWLITDKGVADRADPRGILIPRVAFSDGLDLSGCTASLPLTFADCSFATANADDFAGFALANARLDSLKVFRCDLGPVAMSGLRAASIEVSNSTIGPIDGLGCHIANKLWLQNSTLRGSDGELAINLVNSSIDGALMLLLVDADIDIVFNSCRVESLTVSGCELRSLAIEGCAIEQRLSVQPLKCTVLSLIAAGSRRELRVRRPRRGLCASGLVSLVRSSVGGDLQIDSARLLGRDVSTPRERDRPCALDMRGVTVGGQCSIGVSAPVVTTADVDLSASSFSQDLVVGKLAMLQPEMLKYPYLSLAGSRLDRGLSCSGFRGRRADIDLSHATARGALLFGRTRCRVLKAVDLRAPQLAFAETRLLGLNLNHARIGRYVDDDAGRTLGRGKLNAAGLSVDEFHGGTTDDRLDWLRLQSAEWRASTTPWLSLAAMLDRAGHGVEARKVRFAMRTARVASRGWTRRALTYLSAWIRREPLIVAAPVVFVILAGWTVFSANHCAFIPTRSTTTVPSAAATLNPAGKSPCAPATPEAAPVFTPLVYAIENALPIIKLGQDDKWTPDPRNSAYWWLSITRWCLIAFGWIAGLLLVYGVNQRIRD